jgi:hypothetical protein
MNAELILARLRRFLLWLSGGLCVGTVIELWLTEHTEGLQLVPFVLCGLGLAAVAATLFRPHRFTLWLLRGVMGLLALGSLFGIYEHLESNAGFYLELHPKADTAAVLSGAFTGANPLLAPGILALAALLAWAATYQDPALHQ